ncbi:NAD-dependent epimerase/dehydratase family protein [Vulcanisaeta souniana]|uniref:NAD-dependent epimerase/dehydratase family protein n=1 Tax=Vulcanisaeta souniana TaxID=164452 RepID=UPI0006D0C23C|nr:NAD-dependent epimerase/dehydratase family protein [Vulcanisaeta souniana]
MKILITGGGAGFIGHNLAIYFISKGFDITVLDSLERSTDFAVNRLREHGIPIIKADVRSFSDCNGFDVVVHAAAYVSVPESMERPVDYIENNVVGTARVVHECGRLVQDYLPELCGGLWKPNQVANS